MPSYLSTAFGSQHFLTNYIAKQPKRQFQLLIADQLDGDEQLIDLSGQPTCFETPFIYQRLNSQGDQQLGNHSYFLYFNLSSELVPLFLSAASELFDQKHLDLVNLWLLEKRAKNRQFVLVFSSNDASFSLSDWQNWPKFAKIAGFIPRIAQNDGFHEAGYHLTKRDQQ